MLLLILIQVNVLRSAAESETFVDRRTSQNHLWKAAKSSEKMAKAIARTFLTVEQLRLIIPKVSTYLQECYKYKWAKIQQYRKKLYADGLNDDEYEELQELKRRTKIADRSLKELSEKLEEAEAREYEKVRLLVSSQVYVL